MKKIALVTERSYPFYTGGSAGGQEKTMYEYAISLSSNYSVTVFTSMDKNSNVGEKENLKFISVFPRVNSTNKIGNHSIMWIFLFSINLLRHRKKIKNFDLVILDSITYFYPKVFLKYLRKNNEKVATIFSEAWYEYRRSKGFPRLISLAMGILIKRLIKYSDRIISISDPTSNSLKRNYGVEENKIFTVPSSIHFESISRRFALKPLEYRQYDFVFVGRLAKIKRIDDLINAISIVKKHKKNIKGAIIGDGPLREVFREQIDRLGLNENVILMGFTEEDKKYEILNDSRIFILPSEREGFSLSTLEAMAVGCVPIVAKPKYDEVFGVAHFVKNNINGIYYEVGNIEQLAKSILSLIENTRYLSMLSTSANETARSFDVQIFRRRLLSAVESILSCDTVPLVQGNKNR